MNIQLVNLICEYKEKSTDMFVLPVLKNNIINVSMCINYERNHIWSNKKMLIDNSLF